MVHFYLACAFALLERRAEALDSLKKAVTAGFGPRATIEGDEDLASLRTDPRFAAIVERARPCRRGEGSLRPGRGIDSRDVRPNARERLRRVAAAGRADGPGR